VLGKSSDLFPANESFKTQSRSHHHHRLIMDAAAATKRSNISEKKSKPARNENASHGVSMSVGGHHGKVAIWPSRKRMDSEF
jgi:hypothetical protein